MAAPKAPVVFNPETGVLSLSTSRATFRARLGTEYPGRAETNTANSRVVLLGIIGEPSNVTHVRVRSTHVTKSKAAERIVTADGFMHNYQTERSVPPSKEPKKTPPQALVTVEANALVDIRDSLVTIEALLKEQNALLAKVWT